MSFKLSIIIECRSVDKSYPYGKSKIHALKGVSLSIDAGEYLCITGRSGSGKTTLLNCLGLLDNPDRGEILIEGGSVDHYPMSRLLHIRRHLFSFVFQQFFLIAHLSVLDNVALPLIYRGESWKKARSKARPFLESLGLLERLRQPARWLSGGEAQRVAIARCLIVEPKIIFADEPTGELDLASAKAIGEQLLSQKQKGITLVIATHDSFLQEKSDRLIHLQDGTIVK